MTTSATRIVKSGFSSRENVGQVRIELTAYGKRVTPAAEIERRWRALGPIEPEALRAAKERYDRATAKIDALDPATSAVVCASTGNHGLAVATAEGGNVVRMGEALGTRYRELQSQSPLGMEGHIISLQSEAVVVAINGFLVSLAQAVGIVVVVLLLFMGLRSGLIIGGVLLVTILGTFIFMSAWDVTLQRISLGALVIALGMLGNQGLAAQEAHQAADEVEQALALTPNLENGRRVYLTCAVCHRPEGWGTLDGTYPQVAGQLPEVIIKQLADIRARNRDNNE